MANWNDLSSTTYTVKFFSAKGTCSLRRRDILARNKPDGCFPPICILFSTNWTLNMWRKKDEVCIQYKNWEKIYEHNVMHWTILSEKNRTWRRSKQEIRNHTCIIRDHESLWPTKRKERKKERKKLQLATARRSFKHVMQWSSAHFQPQINDALRVKAHKYIPHLSQHSDTKRQFKFIFNNAEACTRLMKSIWKRIRFLSN